MHTKEIKGKGKYEEFLEVPSAINVKIDGNIVTIASNAVESRSVGSKMVKISIDGNKIGFIADRDNRNIRKLIGSMKAHIKNMFKGVSEGHVYKLKICSGHFPMNVSVSKNELIVKNLLGEKVPRVLKLSDRAKVRVEGDYVIVESSSKEVAGQTAAAIEALTKRANYDKKIFQDGIYIISKDGKDV